MTLALVSSSVDDETYPSSTLPWGKWIAELCDPLWRPGEWDPETRIFLGDISNPMTSAYACAVDACSVRVETFGRRCTRCSRNFVRLNRPQDFNTTFVPDPESRTHHKIEPGTRSGDFTLADYEQTVVSEIVYGLQQRDADQIRLVCHAIRGIVKKLPAHTESILDVDEDTVQSMRPVARGVFRSVRGQVRRAQLIYSGDDPTQGDVWDPVLIGLQASSSRRYIAAFGLIDFRPIRQVWLRELVKQYTREKLPPVEEITQIVMAATVASQALQLRPNGDKPEKLAIGDMSAIQNAYEALDYSGSYKRCYLRSWKNLIAHSRRSGALDMVPGQFAIDPQFRVSGSGDTSEDESGATLPESIIDQLNQHIDLLGTNSSFSSGGWSAADFQFMYRTYYQVIRDTGRRPNEIDSLKRHYLEWADGKPTLLYDNHKRSRMGRRLPIGVSTGRLLQDWLNHLAKLPTTPGTEEWVFPAPGSRNRPRTGHMKNPHYRMNIFQPWVAAIPPLLTDQVDDSGCRVPYDKGRVELYGFRHAYAQRHADAGTPVDTLRELMDHRSADVTMGYYHVSIQRKREAAEIVAQHSVTYQGVTAGHSDSVAYARNSVTVPFGNCIEPSNVAAGGQKCPIRFQCSGCHFYRPDPSYIPAIEEHIADLRANREHAIANSEDWVVDNFNAQIDSFRKVLTVMRKDLNQLTSEQRGLVENASKELRKTRAAAAFVSTDSITARLKGTR